MADDQTNHVLAFLQKGTANMPMPAIMMNVPGKSVYLKSRPLLRYRTATFFRGTQTVMGYFQLYHLVGYVQGLGFWVG